MKIAIYGAGGYGREVAPLARQMGADVLFVTDDPLQVGSTLNGMPVIDFQSLARDPERKVCLTVADSAVRRSLAEKCAARGLGFVTVKARTFVQHDEVQIGEGAIFGDFSMCTGNSTIGRFFQANIYAYIAHDCIVGDFVTLAPRVCINGNTILEDDVYVGTGAVIKQGRPGNPITIGRGAVVGMGAVVTKDVAPGTVVIGNPAKPM